MKRIWVGGLALALVASSGSAFAASDGYLLVAEKGAQALGIVDAASGRELASVPEGGITGHEVTASLDGKTAFVPIYGNSGVGKPGTDGSVLVAIDIASHKIVGHLDFGRGIRPHCPVMNPRDGMLYVTTELDKTVSIIDPKTLKIVGTVPTGQEQSHMLAISPDGLWGYTANVGPGTVSVLDLKARKLKTVIPVSKNVQRISVSRDGKWVFTSDQVKPDLVVIDAATDKIAKRIPMKSAGYGTATTPDGKFLLVPMMDSDAVAVIDLKTMTVARNIDLGQGTHPQETLVRPDGMVAYVSCDKPGKVAEIDMATFRETRLLSTGPVSDGLAWASK
ncbi:cytochrome D1 domain-containing protein [Acidicapsa dinghuensis]|uniref:Cytochrome D1 domain-containing protein n=1 Tax=Acidicapsa dinghuensis TaxID=2218256 RepID=A0ABW1EJP6_9BACT|nr:cytochrome D1 domain-containing protein [Acidicapsa dinghuensis]